VNQDNYTKKLVIAEKNPLRSFDQCLKGKKMIALFNCHSGIAGNMFLGALLHAGVPMDYLITNLKTLDLPPWDLFVTHPMINGIKTTFVEITYQQGHHHRGVTRIKQLITAASLPLHVKETSIKAFELLASAEACAHGIPEETVHFHEVGAIDAIIDIVGSFLGIHYLSIREVFATPINIGGGLAKCAHGSIPVPVPAVSALLKGMPIFSSTNSYELTTPTGAAILAALKPSFSPIPIASPRASGYGAGSYRHEDANYLNLIILEKKEGPQNTTITEIETNIDDTNPEVYDLLIEKLLELGAVDVFLTPIIMKKSRPAIKLSVLCHEATMPALIHEILAQTGTFGLRISQKERTMLDSSFETIQTEWGAVPFRVGKFKGSVISIKPEYEICKTIAKEYNIPLKKLLHLLNKKGEALYDI